MAVVAVDVLSVDAVRLVEDVDDFVEVDVVIDVLVEVEVATADDEDDEELEDTKRAP